MHIYQNPPRDRVIDLVAECDLPTGDLTVQDPELFLGCGSEESPDGVIGLELHGGDGLLRSLAIAERARGQGCGKALVSEIEHLARSQGVRCLYLLTNTAERFFQRLGYKEISRDRVSKPIRNTEEFASLCPDDATVMRKRLDREIGFAASS